MSFFLSRDTFDKMIWWKDFVPIQTWEFCICMQIEMISELSEHFSQKAMSGIRVMNNWNKILNVSLCFPTPVHNQILDIIFRMYYTAKVAVVVVAIYSQLRGKTPGGSWIPAMVVAMPHTGKLLAILPPVLSLPPQYLVKQNKKKVINWLLLNSFRWPGVIYFYC